MKLPVKRVGSWVWGYYKSKVESQLCQTLCWFFLCSHFLSFKMLSNCLSLISSQSLRAIVAKQGPRIYFFTTVPDLWRLRVWMTVKSKLNYNCYHLIDMCYHFCCFTSLLIHLPCFEMSNVKFWNLICVYVLSFLGRDSC